MRHFFLQLDEDSGFSLLETLVALTLLSMLLLGLVQAISIATRQVSAAEETSRALFDAQMFSIGLHSRDSPGAGNDFQNGARRSLEMPIVIDGKGGVERKLIVHELELDQLNGVYRGGKLIFVSGQRFAR